MNINIWLLISNFILIQSCTGQENGSNNSEPLIISPRIVGGKDAKRTERPFQVSLQIRGSHFCGGSIIDEQYIVTAAHCAEGQTASALRIIAGTINLNNKPYRTYKVSKIIIHENYDSENSLRNDIALMKVASPIQFDKYIKAVQLPKSNIRLHVGDRAIVSGWGYESALVPEVSATLKEVEIKIAGQSYCRDVMAMQHFLIYNTQLCAFDESQRKGQCRGDSGGPLTRNGILIGIVSFSVKDPECASTIYPGVYTRVSKFIKWINSHRR